MKNKKGFTIIELLVVIAVVAILVLLAVLGISNYIEKAQITRIQNDIKVVEGKMAEYLIENNIDGLEEILVNTDYFYTKEGNLIQFTEIQEEGPFYVVNELEPVKDANSSLPGDFISNDDGDTYYSDDEVETIPANCYLATDDDFSGTTDGGFKYIGTEKCVIIPETIKGVNVTSYSGMFSNANIDKVISTNPHIISTRAMFYGATINEDFNFKYINMKNVEDASVMFSGSNLQNVIVPDNYTMEDLKNTSNMFVNVNAKNISFGKDFNAPSVIIGSLMFSNSNISNLIIGDNFSMSSEAESDGNFNRMFIASKVNKLSIGNNFTIPKANNGSHMFTRANISNLIIGDNFSMSENAESDGDFSYMFVDLKVIETFEIGDNFNLSKASNGSLMFSNSNISNLIIGDNFSMSENAESDGDFSFMFDNSETNKLSIGNNFNIPKANKAEFMFGNLSSNELSIGDDFSLSSKAESDGSFVHFLGGSNVVESITIGDNFMIPKASDGSRLFYNLTSKSLDIGKNFSLSNEISSFGEFRMLFNQADIDTINIGENFNINKANDTSMMFYNMRATKINIGKNFSFSKNASAENGEINNDLMFASSEIETLNINNIEFRKDANISQTFDSAIIKELNIKDSIDFSYGDFPYYEGDEKGYGKGLHLTFGASEIGNLDLLKFNFGEREFIYTFSLIYYKALEPLAYLDLSEVDMNSIVVNEPFAGAKVEKIYVKDLEDKSVVEKIIKEDNSDSNDNIIIEIK